MRGRASGWPVRPFFVMQTKHRVILAYLKSSAAPQRKEFTYSWVEDNPPKFAFERKPGDGNCRSRASLPSTSPT